MSVQNGKIVAPVGLAEVYGVLGLAPEGMYDVAVACSNEAINAVSKNKPMRVDTPIELTEQQKKQANYGIDIPYTAVATNPDNSLTFADPTVLGDWNYLSVRRSVDWSRLTDFIGYDHFVRFVRGDWGLQSVYLTGTGTTPEFVDRITNEYILDGHLGGAVNVRMRSFNPDKPTQVCPKDMSVGGVLGFIVYKAAPATSPSWQFVKMVIDENGVDTTPGLSGSVTFSNLGITEDALKDGVEMYVRIVGLLFNKYHTNVSDTGAKRTLRFMGIEQHHDIIITSGAFLQVNQVAIQRSSLNGENTVRLSGYAYVLPDYPENTEAKSQVEGYLKAYSQSGTLLGEFSGLTMAQPEIPEQGAVANLAYELAVDDLPYNWHSLEGKFRYKTPTHPSSFDYRVKSESVTVLKSSLGL